MSMDRLTWELHLSYNVTRFRHRMWESMSAECIRTVGETLFDINQSPADDLDSIVNSPPHCPLMEEGVLIHFEKILGVADAAA